MIRRESADTRIFLLAWNFENFEWRRLSKLTQQIREDGFAEGSWSCRAHRAVRTGDRVFLIRLGSEPRGIVGAGWISDRPWRGEDWSRIKSRKRSQWYVSIRWESLRDVDSPLPLAKLLARVSKKFKWTVQGSGVSIPAKIAARLEREWAKLSGRERSAPPIPFEEICAFEGGLKETRVYSRGRSRTLRDQAIHKAQGVCECCEVDYSKLLAGRGVRVLQVHHRKQMRYRDVPSLTKPTDLAVVCANCHMLIHANPERAMPIATLKRLLLTCDHKTHQAA